MASQRNTPAPIVQCKPTMDLDTAIQMAKGALEGVPVGLIAAITFALALVYFLLKALFAESIPSIVVDKPTGIYFDANWCSILPPWILHIFPTTISTLCRHSATFSDSFCLYKQGYHPMHQPRDHGVSGLCSRYDP